MHHVVYTAQVPHGLTRGPCKGGPQYCKFNPFLRFRVPSTSSTTPSGPPLAVRHPPLLNTPLGGLEKLYDKCHWTIFPSSPVIGAIIDNGTAKTGFEVKISSFCESEERPRDSISPANSQPKDDSFNLPPRPREQQQQVPPPIAYSRVPWRTRPFSSQLALNRPTRHRLYLMRRIAAFASVKSASATQCHNRHRTHRRRRAPPSLWDFPFRLYLFNPSPRRPCPFGPLPPHQEMPGGSPGSSSSFNTVLHIGVGETVAYIR